MNRLRTVIGLLFLLMFCRAGADDAAIQNLPHSLAALSAQLSQTQFLSSHFIQTRKLKLLPKPLVSSGDMRYLKNTGICWQLTKPIPASIYLGQDQVVVKDKVSEQRLGPSNPVLGLFSQLFFAVFSGDFSQLESEFKITWQSDYQGWSIQLSPTGELVAKVASQIIVTGSAQIDTVLLHHEGGDTTALQFSATQIKDHRVPSLECGDEF